MSKISKSELKLVFAEIINGYSYLQTEHFGEIKCNHLTNLDSARLDILKSKYIKKAVSKGLPTEEEKLKTLKERGEWSDIQEREIAEQQSYLENLAQTKKQLITKRDREPVLKKIEEAEQKLLRKMAHRVSLLGLTADLYADKKISEYYIIFSLEDEKNNFRFLDRIDELDSSEIEDIQDSYSKKMDIINGANIKRISVSPFFLNFYFLCDKNPQVFYGKPVVELTFHQAELVTHAKKFVNYLENAKVPPPDYLFNDPDSLIEFFEGQKNAEDSISSGEDKDGSTVVGASAKELNDMGLKGDSTNKVSLAEEASKKGGALSMQDLMKIHGVK